MITLAAAAGVHVLRNNMNTVLVSFTTALLLTATVVGADEKATAVEAELKLLRATAKKHADVVRGLEHRLAREQAEGARLQSELAARDATIKQQAAEIERLTAELAKREAPKGGSVTAKEVADAKRQGRLVPGMTVEQANEATGAHGQLVGEHAEGGEEYVWEVWWRKSPGDEDTGATIRGNQVLHHSFRGIVVDGKLVSYRRIDHVDPAPRRRK